MSKKCLLTTTIVSLLMFSLCGCSSKQSTNPSITTTESINPATPLSEEPLASDSSSKDAKVKEAIPNDSSNETQTDDVSDEYSLDTNIKPEELKLGIDTIQKRKAAVQVIGKDDYWIGVMTSCNYIQTQTCADSPIENTIEEAYQDYSATVVQLTSDYDGHMIPADYVLANNIEDNDTIIFIHGASENRRNFNDVCKIYLELGYNILAYDQRSSGENEAPFCTFGYLEQYDLRQYIEYIESKISPDKKIILYARSQGGVTACRVLGSDFGNEKIDGAILDCPLSSMRQIVEPYCVYYIDEKDVDEYFACGDKVLSYFVDGFTMAESEMTNYIKKTMVPTLVLTSKGDTVVDMNMPISIYDAIPGTNKQLYVSETAYHCWINVMEPEIYNKTITDFLDEYLR